MEKHGKSGEYAFYEGKAMRSKVEKLTDKFKNQI